jgi:hypothetical protein
MVWHRRAHDAARHPLDWRLQVLIMGPISRRCIEAVALAALCLMPVVACQPRRPAATPSSSGGERPAEIAQLWIDPEVNRDLFHGAGGARLAPNPKALFRVTQVKIGGFSAGYNVVDDQNRRWSAKFPPEASPEVTVARILWGLGYHQPPVYFLPEWQARGADLPNPQYPARFREFDPDFHGMAYKGNWSFYDNPFLGTRELNGLLVVQAMLGNSDVKDSNNGLFELKTPAESATLWYVVVDTGHSFARSTNTEPVGGDVAVFEKRRFIVSSANGTVALNIQGKHRGLFDRIPAEHVVWVCERLNRLTDEQWRDAFRAGGYEPATGARFIAKMKAMAAEGLALR